MKSQIKFPRNIDKNAKSLMNRLLNKNCQNRLGNGYDELKNHPYFSPVSWDSLYNQTIPPEYKPNSGTIIRDIEVEKCLKKPNCKMLTKFLKERKNK